jgi:hypothetical protein
VMQCSVVKCGVRSRRRVSLSLYVCVIHRGSFLSSLSLTRPHHHTHPLTHTHSYTYSASFSPRVGSFIATTKSRYDGTNSEGNRFIVNDDL